MSVQRIINFSFLVDFKDPHFVNFNSLNMLCQSPPIVFFTFSSLEDESSVHVRMTFLLSTFHVPHPFPVNCNVLLCSFFSKLASKLNLSFSNLKDALPVRACSWCATSLLFVFLTGVYVKVLPIISLSTLEALMDKEYKTQKSVGRLPQKVF